MPLAPLPGKPSSLKMAAGPVGEVGCRPTHGQPRDCGVCVCTQNAGERVSPRLAPLPLQKNSQALQPLANSGFTLASSGPSAVSSSSASSFSAGLSLLIELSLSEIFSDLLPSLVKKLENLLGLYQISFYSCQLEFSLRF